jgi:hypothetical protein
MNFLAASTVDIRKPQTVGRPRGDICETGPVECLMIIKVFLLAITLLTAGTPVSDLTNNRAKASFQASFTPLESRIIHLRMGTVINTTIMNGTSFVVALA